MRTRIRRGYARLFAVIAVLVAAALIAGMATGRADARRGKAEPPSKMPVSIELSANPLSIRCDGSQSSTLSVRLRDGKGRDVPNGTDVTFFNPYGPTNPVATETRKGRAETDVRVFGEPFAPDLAQIHVEAGDLRASFGVRCIPAPPCPISPPAHPMSPPCPTPTPTPAPCWPISPPAESPPCEPPPTCVPGGHPMSPPECPPEPCVPNGHEMSPPECPTPCDDDDPDAQPCPPRQQSSLTIDVTCDISSPIVEASCRATPGTTIEVGFVVTNRTAAPVGVASFQFALVNDNRGLLQPLPGADNNLNGNPDFEEASFASPDTWTCAIPAPKPDTGEGGPERSVSWMGCFTIGGEQAVIQPGERLLLARVAYQVAFAGGGEATLEFGDVFVGDDFANTVGYCTPVDDFACDGAVIRVRGETPTPVVPTPVPTFSFPLIPREQQPGGGAIATPAPGGRRTLN